MTPIEFKLTFINSRRLERFGFVAEPEDSPEVLWDKVRSRPTSPYRWLQFLNSSLLLEIQAPSDRSQLGSSHSVLQTFRLSWRD